MASLRFRCINRTRVCLICLPLMWAFGPGSAVAGMRIHEASQGKGQTDEWAFLSLSQSPANCDPIKAHGAIRGLVIGISEYSELEESFQLPGAIPGAKNDASLFAATLKQFGGSEGDVVVLNGRVTYREILQQFERLVQSAQCGDNVFIHWSGAGFMAKAFDPWGNVQSDSHSGEYVLLASDSSKRSHIYLSIHKLAALIRTLRIIGANVMLTIDTDTSGLLELVRETSVPYWRWSPGSQSPDQGNSGNLGSFAGFYASVGASPERMFPEGEPGRKPYGVFTYTLVMSLGVDEQLTYRSLSERVSGSYRRNLGTGNSTLPVFESTDPDRNIFGGSVHRITR